MQKGGGRKAREWIVRRAGTRVAESRMWNAEGVRADVGISER